MLALTLPAAVPAGVDIGLFDSSDVRHAYGGATPRLDPGELR